MRPVAKAFGQSITIIVLVLLLIILGVRIRRDMLPSTEPTANVGLPGVGETITVLPPTEWDANRVTLILALQVGCHWCEKSAEFYRDLLRSNVSGTFHPLFVLPQPVIQSQAFLHDLGLDVSNIRQVDFAELGVHGTPTLILADQHGRVLSTWEGYLSPVREEDVFRKLGVSRSRGTNVSSNMPAIR
jgi:thioredoxin-related protein